MRTAQANVDYVDAELETEKLQIRLQVEQAVLTVRAAKASIDAANEALVNAREQLRLAEGRYEAGVGSIIELGDAQVAATAAAAQVVQSGLQPLDSARAAPRCARKAVTTMDIETTSRLRAHRRRAAPRHPEIDDRKPGAAPSPAGASIAGCWSCSLSSSLGGGFVRRPTATGRRGRRRGGRRAEGARRCPSRWRPSCKKDVPIWLEGLGNATPLATVNVEDAGRRADRQRQLQGGPDRPQGRPPRPGRPAPVRRSRSTTPRPRSRATRRSSGTRG